VWLTLFSDGCAGACATIAFSPQWTLNTSSGAEMGLPLIDPLIASGW
jgi:hypothetical protein